MEHWILYAISVLLALFVGGFLKSYVSRKGENLATHEDIQKLVDQVRAVTATTEEIKATVSNEQREWQLKKELLRELTGQIATLRKECVDIVAFAQKSMIAPTEHEREGILGEMNEARRRFRDAMHAFLSTQLIMRIALVRW